MEATVQSPFEGRLVRLRAHEPEDEPLLYQWYNDPEITQHLALRYPLSHQSERQFIERTTQPGPNGAHFAVVLKDTGQLIGGAGLNIAFPENREAILGISIGDKDYWDRGYGTDTMRTLCRFGFEHMNLHRIQLDVYANNERARHVYERIGFQVEGRRREAVYKYGRYDDIIVMGLLEGELVME
jgi:RimJ/RimL family protein N-acetyltransferase